MTSARHPQYELGLVGLGVMGRNFLQNLADHGYRVAGYDKAPEQTEALRKESKNQPIGTAESVSALVEMLRRPRAVLILVPAGQAVDTVIKQFVPHLESGDLIIDAGNSHFADTDLRMAKVGEKGIAYLGVGISGGEYGARHGPSIMPGGSFEAYQRVAPLFDAAAAKVDGEPCVSYLGPGSAGHYVKMIHNGIEYGLMQLIAESYDLMRRGLKLDDVQIADTFERWNEGELAGYLIEITGRIFRREDPRTNAYLIDVIRDEARQKGTGMWASQDAMKIQVPVPTIDIAVAMRHLSVMDQEREEASGTLSGPAYEIDAEKDAFLQQLREALLASMIVTYAQGMAQLRRASGEYRYDLNLAEVARIWRGGCIIRSAMLDPMRAAYEHWPELANLLLAPHFAEQLERSGAAWRQVMQTAVQAGIPVPAMAVSLSYFDAYRSRWLPANLIEAQRDLFGAHSFERIDEKGTFHVDWSEPPSTSSTQPDAMATGGHER